MMLDLASARPSAAPFGHAVTLLRRAASLLLAPAALLPAQMHSVAKPDQVTRAVAVYEYVGDLQHPKAARLTPVSLFIGGHFEDAGVYLARPVPFALDSGLRYELQRAGIRQDFFDVVASRHFSSRTAAAAAPYDDSWFGYGRVSSPPAPKAARVRPNCGNARVVQEADTAKKDDGKPHFGTKPNAESDAPQTSRRGRNTAPDPCLEYGEDSKPERVSLADDTRGKDKDAPDPERPTLHRSPETTAHNTGSQGKPDKKAPKPPPATITANGGPADDPDRPTIRHRATDENDPNALPPDPMDLASRERSPATTKGAAETDSLTAVPMTANDTVAEGGTITAGNTTGGAPTLRRGRVSAPPPDPPAITASTRSSTKGNALVPKTAAAITAAPLDAVVAVSDARERATHDFSYHFSSPTERAAALNTLQGMAMAVLANPALATDAPGLTGSSGKEVVPAATPAPRTTRTAAGRVRSGVARTRPIFSPVAAPTLADEELNAFQLYYSAPVSYTYTARMPATATQPERFITVIAQTDAEGKLQAGMRSVTDAAHLDRVPRYRLIDAVDADGTNRASLLMELRAQHSRQFALYRLLGNKADQIFLSGTTLL